MNYTFRLTEKTPSWSSTIFSHQINLFIKIKVVPESQQNKNQRQVSLTRLHNIVIYIITYVIPNLRTSY